MNRLSRQSPPNIYYAHAHPDRPRTTWHQLQDHLEAVARLAAGHAQPFGGNAWGNIAGLWHDLGKYRQEFQDYLVRGGERGSVHHAPVGAWHALRQGNPLLAVIVNGHHVGLPALSQALHNVEWRTHAESLYEDALNAPIPANLLNPHLPEPPDWLDGLPDDTARRQAMELWTRMVFSALVDADFLDTEAWFNGSGRPPGSIPISALLNRLNAHLHALQQRAPDTPVNRWRREALTACRVAASMSPGVFTLSVPTGGGKTLSGMTFALSHAVAHGLRRVIVVIPWTSIIEQNAEVYRNVFGEASVIEHHSALDPEAETLHNRLASENWDAPVVVTTSVQFLESLFSDRPSRCRKLHNIARSVVLFDEVQALPVHLLTPTLSVLNELVDHYGISLVLSTATQPALEERRVGLRTFPGLRNPRPIIQNADALFRAFQRVEVEWPEDLDRAISWPALAERVAQHPRVLVITHRRRDARTLVELLPPGALHLSALMTSQHRTAVLAHIRQRLQDPSLPCRVVATQLVEAGVDIDFPVVFRAMAGLDSLAQAAGRCNREGLLPERGRFIVFVAPTQPPPGVLSTGLEVALGLAQSGDRNLSDPSLYTRYFTRLYDSWDTDTERIQTLRAELNFPEVALRYHLIEDDWSVPVVVPHDVRSRGTIERLRHTPPNRALFRALQRYTINIPRSILIEGRQVDLPSAWIERGILEVVGESQTLVLSSAFLHLYTDLFGLDIYQLPNSLI